ncbi:hypothetical protein [Dactylosporangium sp. NPDC049140]|uniref:hypothetical protein n=1 Tax=Dactylosporangium sp. NPDC049140 TaxID=3155647 RepID=UPI0033FCC0ED
MTADAYTFLPWLRTGLATRITADPGTADRASVPVTLRVTGDRVPGGPPQPLFQDVRRTVQIYGPGDVIGLDARAVSRAEPRPWITNAEPNYLAHIEFSEEDLPWRYSPAPPDPTTSRVAPWLALVVLAGPADMTGSPTGAEFSEGAQPDRPLPFITVLDPATTLPPAGQLGAWAHVHVNGSLDAPVAADDMGRVLPALQQLLREHADDACSRLVCPRHLDPDTSYHAFLVPAFETGRLAGLGLDPSGAPGALHPAWGTPYPNAPVPGQLPYYYRWFFSTGPAGDFEYLVRLLRPRPLDPAVGRRDLDVHRSPGAGLPGITTPAALGGVLKLGGALRQPDREPDAFDTWDEPYPHPFQRALADLINLADDYVTESPAAAHARLAAPAAAPPAATGDDPVITPPLYGRWPALTTRLLTDRDGAPVTPNRNWVHRLNLDPRFRVAANLGADVVRQRQEEFMAASWAQIGDVLAANARIRAGQLAREVGTVLQAKHLAPSATTLRAAATSAAAATPSGRVLALTAPANARVVEPAPLVLAPEVFADGGFGAGSGIERVAVGFRVAASRVAAAPVSPAMRRLTRPGSRLIRTLPFTAQRPPDALLSRMDGADGGVTAAPPKTVPPAIVTPDRLSAALHPPPAGPSLAAAAADDPVGGLASSPDFVLTLPGDTFVPSPGAVDSPEAARFKDALRDLHGGWDAAAAGGAAPPRAPLGVTAVTDTMLAGLHSDDTVPRRLLTEVSIPPRLAPFAERFIEAMAYPVFDLPTYRELLAQGTDLFVPNLNLVPPNSISLLETDQEFIEAYLVGLNHEMARELLWREYPTDQRGTPFRQFWDVRTMPALPGETVDERRERLYDIPPIHTWPASSKLGAHDHRDTGTQENELVLLIRGELLKKYPNAAIYAHRARWQLADGRPDPAQERLPVTLADPAAPTLDEIRLPIYQAEVEPDIHLLGFDLTADEAKGKVPQGSAGWFFIIKERPGDPRFGLDAGDATRVEVWNDLSWSDVDPGRTGFIRLDGATTAVPLLEFDDPAGDQEKRDQHVEDLSLPLWHAGLSSADIAYVLFQAPVLMAVHAQEMLP